MPSATARAALLACAGFALVYLAALLLGPVAIVFYRTFEHGLGPSGTR